MWFSSSQNVAVYPWNTGEPRDSRPPLIPAAFPHLVVFQSWSKSWVACWRKCWTIRDQRAFNGNKNIELNGTLSEEHIICLYVNMIYIVYIYIIYYIYYILYICYIYIYVCIYIYAYLYVYNYIYMGPKLLYISICSGNKHSLSNYFGVLSGSLDCGAPWSAVEFSQLLGVPFRAIYLLRGGRTGCQAHKLRFRSV